MGISTGIVEAIGNTPLIKLQRASAATGCTILGKAEFMNPGQSVKDRAALFIIQDAVKRGALKPGGVIVEGTAGNTGIGLALVGNALGFRSVIVIPDTQSPEKKDMLRLCGAELVEVPAVPYSNPNNYVKLSGRLAEQLARSEKNGAIWANQFDNVANRQGHVETTGREIWEQTGGKVDGFICAVGTGGTLAGVGIALKARNPKVRIGLADPFGAALYSYYTSGELKSEGTSITEGIGQGRITQNLQGAPIDVALPDCGRGSGDGNFRPLGARRALPWRLFRHQRGRRGAARKGAWPWPHHRDSAGGLRHALSIETLQSRIPARKRSAGAGMVGAQIEHPCSLHVARTLAAGCALPLIQRKDRS